MKTITICGKEYEMECNALTYVKYNNFFDAGILKDMHFIQEYLVKQAVIAKQLDEKGISEAEKFSQLSKYMINDTDEFIVKIQRIAWILIYSANNKVESFDEWLAGLKDFNVNNADWISEVTEFAVSCFC